MNDSFWIEAQFDRNQVVPIEHRKSFVAISKEPSQIAPLGLQEEEENIIQLQQDHGFDEEERSGLINPKEAASGGMGRMEARTDGDALEAHDGRTRQSSATGYSLEGARAAPKPGLAASPISDYSSGRRGASGRRESLPSRLVQPLPSRLAKLTPLRTLQPSTIQTSAAGASGVNNASRQQGFVPRIGQVRDGTRFGWKGVQSTATIPEKKRRETIGDPAHRRGGFSRGHARDRKSFGWRGVHYYSTRVEQRTRRRSIRNPSPQGVTSTSEGIGSHLLRDGKRFGWRGQKQAVSSGEEE